MGGWKGLKHRIKQSPADECSSPTNPQTSVTKSPFKVHSSRKKSLGGNPLNPDHGASSPPTTKKKGKKLQTVELLL